MALLPGAFNPLHEGHLALAALTEKLTGKRVAFELSSVNVEKADLPHPELQRRAAQFRDRYPVWLTSAALFLEKAALFPGATFVIGADTAVRLVAPCYYGGEPARVTRALSEIRAHECRFLVAGRVDAAGKFLCLDDIELPALHRDLFTAIAAQEFRMDVSSTAIRARRDAMCGRNQDGS